MLSQLKCQGLRICIRCIRTVVPSSSSLRGTLLFLRHHAQMTHMNIQICTLYSHRTLHTSLHTVTSLIPNHSTTHGTCGLQSGSRCERTHRLLYATTGDESAPNGKHSSAHLAVLSPYRALRLLTDLETLVQVQLQSNLLSPPIAL